MKNILIFAGIAGLAAAVAIYFVTESDKNTFIDDDEEGFITDADIAAYDMRENTGPATPVNDGFRPAY